MTDALSPTVPAGWYPDPWGSASRRWWDGSAWSAKVTASPEGSEPPPDGSPSDERYEPAAVRATYAPPAHVDEVPAPASPFPSRRALRQSTVTEDGSAGEPVGANPGDGAAPDPTAAAPEGAALAAEPLPAFTQVPEFTPEPVSILAPPVWTEPEAPTPAASVEPARPGPAETVAVVASQAVTGVAPATPAEEPAASTVAPASVPDPNDEWAASLAWDDIETPDAVLADATPIFGDAPPVSYSQRAVRYKPLHGRTSPVWMIVLLPIIHAAAVVGSTLLFPRAFVLDGTVIMVTPAALGNPALLGEWLIFAAAPLGIAFFLFTLIMGFQDRARLRLLGHDETASPWWIVLHPLVYLIVRSIRVRQCTGRRGSGPLTTYLCLYVAPPIALVVATAVISALDGAIPA